MDELENPFRPWPGSPPPLFAGRVELVERFRGAIARAARGRSGESIVAYGLHGVGKTVLLNRVADLAEREGLRVGYVEAPHGGGLARLVAAGLRAVAEPRVGGGDDSAEPEQLTALFVAAGRAAVERSSGVVLLVDELHQLTPPELAALASAIERTVQLDLPVVLAAAGLQQLPLLLGDAKRSAQGVLALEQLGPLAADEARDALKLPVRERGVKLRRRALDRLVELTQGYPGFVQAWGSAAWSAATGASIDLEDVDRAAPAAQRILDERFSSGRLDRLTPAELSYVRAMAALGPGPHRSGEVAAQLGVPVERVAPRRAALIQKGILHSPARGETAFSVPLFDDFLRRRADQSASRTSTGA